MQLRITLNVSWWFYCLRNTDSARCWMAMWRLHPTSNQTLLLTKAHLCQVHKLRMVSFVEAAKCQAETNQMKYTAGSDHVTYSKESTLPRCHWLNPLKHTWFRCLCSIICIAFLASRSCHLYKRRQLWKASLIVCTPTQTSSCWQV